MSKLKTKSSCKRRFKISGTGKVIIKHSGKSHMMTKRNKVQIRDKRKSGVMSASDSKFVLKKFLSYFKKLRKIL